MFGEYAALIGANGFFSSLMQIPNVIVNFLHTREGQIAAVIFVVVLFFISGKRK